MKTILDPCCGPRSMWFDPDNEAVVFGDQRCERITVTDRSHGKADGKRVLHIEPDQVMDFRAIPYPDNSFALVAFDPPHLGAGPKSWLAARYGKLSDDWREHIAKGFAECFQVLKPTGVRFQMERNSNHVTRYFTAGGLSPLFGQKKPSNDATVFRSLTPSPPIATRRTQK